jgi:hypothetical protein
MEKSINNSLIKDPRLRQDSVAKAVSQSHKDALKFLEQVPEVDDSEEF